MVTAPVLKGKPTTHTHFSRSRFATTPDANPYATPDATPARLDKKLLVTLCKSAILTYNMPRDVT